MMPTVELLVSSAALLGAAFVSSALLSCKSDPVAMEPPAASSSAPAPVDANDPAALQRAAAVVSAWNQKDPALTARTLKDNGIVITDPATFQAMADAGAAASASASAVATTAPVLRQTAAPPQKRPPPSTISAPVA